MVDDGPDAQTRAAAEGAGARYVAHERSLGLNAARNTAIAATDADWLFFVDDDVEVRPGWLAALLAAARGAGPEVAVLAGAIHARIENPRYRQCGREGAPITFLGPRTAASAGGRTWASAARGWSASARSTPAASSTATSRSGRTACARRAGAILWVPEAALDHVRSGPDATVRALARAAYARGQASRRYDVFKGRAPSRAAELALLARATLHGPLHRCSNGPVMAAHSLGRLRAHAHSRGQIRHSRACPDFLSGGVGACRREAGGAAAGRGSWGRRRPPRRSRGGWTATTGRVLKVLVLAIVRPQNAGTWAAARAELERSRHDVEIRETGRGGRREVPEPERAARRRRSRRRSTGCSSATTTSSCRRASSIASSPAPGARG